MSFENFCFRSIYYRLFTFAFTKNILGNKICKTSLEVLIPSKWYQIFINFPKCFR